MSASDHHAASTLRDEALSQAIRAGTAPGDSTGIKINLAGAGQDLRLPTKLRCYSLDLTGAAITDFPIGPEVSYRLNLSNCQALTELPAGLKTGKLNLSGCTALKALPEALDVNYLDVGGCTGLDSWPESARVYYGSVDAHGCFSLETLPSGLGPLTNLNLADCTRLRRLPPGLKISGWLDLAGTQIDSLPESLSRAVLRWRGVRVSAQVVFFPETLTTEQILAEVNTEVRRVMMERFGLDRFMAEAKAIVLDEDTDPGGPRQLLRVPIAGDEDLVAVSMKCPSTGRQYLVRVPPTTRTCHQAIAWTAGFDNPDEYHPLAES